MGKGSTAMALVVISYPPIATLQNPDSKRYKHFANLIPNINLQSENAVSPWRTF